MPTYKTSFDQLRLHPGMSDVLHALERGFTRFGIDYYLIGAISRDVWMRALNNIAPRRATRDIDFAVFINDKGIYEQLKEYLVAQEGFAPYQGNAFVLLWKDGSQVDLLPFGAIEDEGRRVTVQGTGYTSIHVDGIREVYEQQLPDLVLEGEHRFKFTTLPGLVLLKLIAWDDRPETRRDDIKDISDILRHFFDMYSDAIYEEHNDLFKEEQTGHDTATELLMIAARVLGRELRQIVRANLTLLERIQRILEENMKSTSRMASIMTEYFENTIENNVRLISEIQIGFHE